MSNDFDSDLVFVKDKKTRHFHYEMKVLSGKENLIVHARKSKKGGATFAKLIDDASFLLMNGLIDFDNYVKSGNLEKLIVVQSKLYDDSPKPFGIALFGWSPEEINKIRELAKESEKK